MGQLLSGYSRLSQHDGEPIQGVLHRMPCFKWCVPALTPLERFEAVERRFLTEVSALAGNSGP